MGSRYTRVVYLLLLVLLACGPAPEPPPVDPDAPRRYRVLRGDSLKTIASKRSCSPEDLIAWNHLGTEPLLVPGQILKIYRANFRPESKDRPSQAEPDAGPPPASGRVAEGTPSPRHPPSTTASESSPPQRPDASVSRAPATPRKVEVGSASKNGVAILSLLDDLGDADLVHVASVKPSGATPGQAGLKGRSLDGSVDVDATAVEIHRRPASTVSRTATGSGRTPALKKASPKTCLPVVMRDLGDEGMAAPDGLDRAAIRRGMAPIVAAAAGCLAPEARGDWTLHLEVTVGCDGLVYQAEVIMDGGLPTGVTRCVTEVAEQGSFDASQGVTPFVYPIRFSGA